MKWPLDSKFYEIIVEECISLSQGIENEEILAEPKQLRKALQTFLNFGVTIEDLESCWRSKTNAVSLPNFFRQ